MPYRWHLRSLRCQQRFGRERRYIEFLHGNYPPLVQVTKFLRWAIIRNLGIEACTRCGWAERHPITGRIPMEVEHIDGDWQNNRPDNLTLLCPSCHSLTPTYRALNKGKGRGARLGGRENPLHQASGESEGAVRILKKRRPFKPEGATQLSLYPADVAQLAERTTCNCVTPVRFRSSAPSNVPLCLESRVYDGK
jgi:hypothetical protein